MNKNDFHQTQITNNWFAQNGVNVAHIYAGTKELFQAQKLATQTLKEHGKLLQHNQSVKLNNFLQATRSYKKRNKITQGQCFKILNIAKQAQRLCAKLNKKQN
jgi:hypothetical protein